MDNMDNILAVIILAIFGMFSAAQGWILTPLLCIFFLVYVSLKELDTQIIKVQSELIAAQDAHIALLNGIKKS